MYEEEENMQSLGKGVFMKKILVVLTGGTIGSRVKGKTVDVTEESAYQLLSLYREKYGEEEFEVCQPFSILSEDMTPFVWAELCDFMRTISYEDYQGVILTHGSDTLSYTAALLGMLIGNLGVPVVLTAADRPLEDEKGNGLINFAGCVRFVRENPIGGVFVVYQDRQKRLPVYLATRLVEADPYEDAFAAFGGVPFGYLEKEGIRFVENEINPSLKELAAAGSFLKTEALKDMESFSFRKSILLLKSYPGLDYSHIRLSDGTACVLHYLYHSATGRTGEGAFSLPEFAGALKKKKIPLYTASYKEPKGRLYVTTQKIIEQGAVPLVNISPEAAYAKLVLLYNTEQPSCAEKLMGKNLFFEHLL